MDTYLIMDIFVKYYSCRMLKLNTVALISHWTFFVFIFHDPSYRMTKPSYMIEFFRIDVEKRFVNFYCRTKSFAKHLQC